MNRKEFTDLLDRQVLVCDGAMGTRLYELGIGFDHSFDELNLTRPELIRGVHAEYIAAGADIIETNSFGANRVRLSHCGLEERVGEVAKAAATLARESVDESGREVLVAGSVGPLGKPLAPIGQITRAEAAQAFRECIVGLLDGGVDLLMLETFVDQVEITEALRVARELAPQIPIVAHMTFTDEGKTIYGNKPEEVVAALTELGADVVGANCSVGPQGLGEVLDRMLRVPGALLSMMPNAGMPQLVGGRYLYLSSPEYMASYALEFVGRGVRIVGGCCGTGRAHVEEMARQVGGRPPVLHTGTRKTHKAITAVATVEESKSVDAEPQSPSFLDKIRDGEFVVSVELDPPRGIDPSRLVKGAAMCKANGIDVINIADSPLARARMSPLALATIIRQSVDIEIILHMSCRDRNLLGLQSECMGAHALGVRNILCVTGDPPQVGDYPDATGVFDVDAIGLTTLLRRLNEGTDLAEKKVDYHTEFVVGVASNPTAVDLDLEHERFVRKVAAGAEFTMTQPIYDVADMEAWLEKAPAGVPSMVGVLPLRNGRHAEFLHNEVPGMSVPKRIRERMHRAGEEGPKEGVLIAQEFLAECKHLVQGAYLMPPFNRFEMAIEVCRDL